VLEVETVKYSWSRLMGEKPFRYTSGHTAVSKATPLGDRSALVEGMTSSILPLIVRNFLLKKFMKSLLLRSMGILGSTEL